MNTSVLPGLGLFLASAVEATHEHSVCTESVTHTPRSSHALG